MADKEIKKPSLTQRRKITGSKDLSNNSSPKSNPTKGPSTKSTSLVDDSDDISVVKVVMVVVAVIIVAVVAAFLIQATQGGGDSNDDENIAEENNDPTPTPDIEEEPEPTEEPEVTIEPSIEPEPTMVPTPTDEGEPEGEVLTNEFGQDKQFLNTSNTGVTIRTYRYLNTSQYYQFSLPIQNDAIPDAEAYYDSSDNLVLEVKDVNSFVSCGYLNDNSTSVAYGNVQSATCSRSGSTVTFTLILNNKTDFKLTTGTVDIDGEEVLSILLQIK